LIFLFHYSKAQTISTFAGCGLFCTVIGDDGPATGAAIPDPICGTFDKFGNYYFATGLSGNRIRKVNTIGIITTVAGNGTGGFSGDGTAATAASINAPVDVKLDTFGNLYISEPLSYRIRKVDIATGIITTIAGNGTGTFYGEGIPATDASLWGNNEICLDRSGNLYIADYYNQRVRKVSTSGIITTFAGTGTPSSTGDGGAATDAMLFYPESIAIDDTGNIYIGEASGFKVRKVNTAGIISTVAGNGMGYTYTVDGIPATDAEIEPLRLAFDHFGNLFIGDNYNDIVLKVDVAGIIHKVAGNGITGFSGDGGPATAAEFDYPSGVSIDLCGNLYITEADNRRVRKVTFNPVTALTDTPVVAITASPAGTLCSGTTVTYHAAVIGGGLNTFYKWYVNGVDVSGIDSLYAYSPADGDSVTCIVTTVNLCSLPAVAAGNMVHVVVTPSVTPTISIAASTTDTVCAGTAVTYTASVTNGGATPAYQWYKDGVPIGAASSYTYTPADEDSIRCVLVSSAACAVPAAVSSGSIDMVVRPMVTPTISIAASPGDTVCAGTSVTFTATTTDGGGAPVYTWVVNGVPVTATGATYAYSPANGDIISCTLTGSAPCATAATATSGSIHMVVHSTVTPAITITSEPSDTVCAEVAVTFTATATGGGATPAYQWLVDGSVAGTGGASYTFTPLNGDSIRCVLTSSAPCAVPATVSSTTINMVVDTFIIPTIALTGITATAAGTTVTVTATVANAGSSYTIYWMDNGATFATTSTPTATYTKTRGIDTITAKIVSTSPGCYDTATATAIIINTDYTGIAVPGFSKGDVTVWPNPSKNDITITSFSRIENVTICNMLGQTIYNATFNENNVVVNVSTFPAGVYEVKVNGIYVQKMVKE